MKIKCEGEQNFTNFALFLVYYEQKEGYGRMRK